MISKVQMFIEPACIDCPCSDNSVKYSRWHYCTNPNNSREFQIIRHYQEFGDGKWLHVLAELPHWCPIITEIE